MSDQQQAAPAYPETLSTDIAPEENVIRDGATQRGYIAENPGLWGALDFRFRPILGQVAEQADLDIEAKLKAHQGQEAYLLEARYVLEHLVSWKRPEPISIQTLALLRRQVLIRMFSIMKGDLRSDPIPGAKGGPGEPTGDEALKKLLRPTPSAS